MAAHRVTRRHAIEVIRPPLRTGAAYVSERADPADGGQAPTMLGLPTTSETSVAYLTPFRSYGDARG
jgi:hypothetical protein